MPCRHVPAVVADSTVGAALGVLGVCVAVLIVVRACRSRVPFTFKSHDAKQLVSS
jgi:hypothetical protein